MGRGQWITNRGTVRLCFDYSPNRTDTQTQKCPIYCHIPQPLDERRKSFSSSPSDFRLLPFDFILKVNRDMCLHIRITHLWSRVSSQLTSDCILLLEVCFFLIRFLFRRVHIFWVGVTSSAKPCCISFASQNRSTLFFTTVIRSTTDAYGAGECTRDCALVIHLTQPSVTGSTESTTAPATPALATFFLFDRSLASSHPYVGYASPQATGGASATQ